MIDDGIILKDEMNGRLVMVVSKRICISLHKIRTRDFIFFWGIFLKYAHTIWDIHKTRMYG